MIKSLLPEPFKIDFIQTEMPLPGENEVLIRMIQAGICGSDVHMYKHGHQFGAPLTMGHEGIGIIAGTGKDVNSGRTGERVIIEPNIPCLHCPECRKGRGNICRNKRKIGVSEHGCFAEYAVVPADFAHKLPDTITDRDAVAIEPAVVALAALKRSDAKPGDTIAVIGLGAIGMLLTHAALAFGYRVVVSDIVDEKVKMATDMGAIAVPGSIKAMEDPGSLENLFREAEVSAVFECAGTGKTASLAIKAAPRGADVILLGLSEDPASFSPRLLSQKGNNIIPSLIYDHPVDFQKCISLIEKGFLKPGIVVSRYFRFQELQEALKAASLGREGKIVVTISEQ